MDTLKVQSKERDTIEIVKQQVKDLQKVLLGSSKNLNRGHKLFKVDLVNKTIVEAEFELDTSIKWAEATSIKAVPRKKVIVSENCTYLFGLNKKSILKQLEREGVVF